jgi:hypothetical protein
MLSSFLTAIFSSIQNCPSAHRMSSVSPTPTSYIYERNPTVQAVRPNFETVRNDAQEKLASLASARCTDRLRQVSTFLYSWFISGPQMPQQQALD